MSPAVNAHGAQSRVGGTVVVVVVVASAGTTDKRQHARAFARLQQVEAARRTMSSNSRNPAALRRWLRSYAAATTSCASYEKIRDAATSGDGDKPARSTTQPYRDSLQALDLLDPLPAWSPSQSHTAELGEPPKHHLVDPALAASLLGVGAGALLDGDMGSNRHPVTGTLRSAFARTSSV